MVGIQHIIQKRRVLTLMVLVGVLFMGTPLFAFAALTSFQEWILGFSMGTGGFFAGVGGLLLDKTVTVFILQMGDWFVNKGVGAVVTSVWMMIRDLFNILFIFTLVYIGLRTILNSEDSGTKKMLGMLIAAALLINFSLYIAKVVVDVANFTAVQVYTTATSGITGTYGLNYVYKGAGGGILSEEKSLAGAYMQVLDISGWFSTGVIGDRIYTYSLIMLFFLMFLGFVFAYGAIMLTARFIAIIFYLMFSPFMFLGWILPQFQQYATKWWKGFIGYSFYAPIYLFMLYIGLYSLQQIKTGLGIQPGKSYGAAFEGTTFADSTMSVFLLFTIGVGFLVGAMKVAGIVSGGGAAIGMGAFDKFSRKWTTGMGKNAFKSGGAATGGFMYRQTGGRLGKGLQNISEAVEKRTGRSSMLTRSLRSGGESMQSKKVGGAASYKDKKEAVKTGDARASRSSQVHKHRQTLALDDSTTDNIAKKQEVFANMSDAQLIEIAKTKEGRKLITDNAQMLSASQMQAIIKSEDINDTNTSNIGQAHSTAMKAHVATNGGVGKASSDQLNALGVEELKKPENAVHLTDDKIDKLKLVDAHKNTLKEARKTALIEVAKGENMDGVTIDTLVNTKNPAYLAKLPKEMFTHKDFVLKLPSSAIQSRDFGNLDHTIQSSIKSILVSQHPSLIAHKQEYDRIGEILDWFANSPQGKSFGK